MSVDATSFGAAGVAARTPERDLVEELCDAVRDVPGDARGAVESQMRRVAPLADPTERAALVEQAVARLTGLGTIAGLLADPTVDEVLVNAGGELWVERDGHLERVGAVAADELAVVLERVLAPLARRLDLSHPIVDARLPDGSRLCAAIPPVAVDGTCVAIRRLRSRHLPLESFATSPVIALLGEIVQARCNVVVSGATSAGKTSLLDALLATLPAGERLVTIEDTAELKPRTAHVVRLEARAAAPDGPGAIDLPQLVRTALRLRPDRLVVGEVRGDEVLGLVQAMNTGHDGSLATCHANGPLDALHRIETLVMQAAPGWPLAAVRRQLQRSIDVVIHVNRTTTAARRITAIAEVDPSNGGGDGPLPTLHVVHLVAGDDVVGTLTRRRR